MSNSNSDQIREADESHILSDEEAEELAEAILAVVPDYTDGADQLVAAVLRVVDYFTYTRNMAARESSMNFLGLALYRKTADCSRQLSNFERLAGCKNGE